MFENVEARITMNIKSFAPKQRKEIESSYSIHEVIGQGTFGCVKRIVHKDLRDERAMKIIKKKSLASEEEFLHEIEMLKSIDHPNVLKYYECY